MSPHFQTVFFIERDGERESINMYLYVFFYTSAEKYSNAAKCPQTYPPHCSQRLLIEAAPFKPKGVTASTSL